MKTTALFLTAILGISASFNGLSAQCTPDPACVDTGDPGQLCPEEFPTIYEGQFYDQSLTFILPAREYDVEGTIFTLDSVALDSIRNVPPGMSYYTNSDGFAAGKAYCAQLSGTPGQTGIFQIEMYLRVFATPEGGESLELGQFIDDTTVQVTVEEFVGISSFRKETFQVLPTLPNPYSDYTQIRFFTPRDDQVKLQVYSILGELMYEERYGASPGEHRFDFRGSDLESGTYFFHISNSYRTYTGKFIKVR